MSDVSGAAENPMIGMMRALIAQADGETNKPKDKAFKNIDASIEWTGTKITLPADPRPMQINEGIEWLKRRQTADEAEIAINEEIDAYPWDGAVAFMRAMKEIYGWVEPVPTPGFFGPQPPTMVAIETDVGEMATIFWGRFQLPGIHGHLQCQWGEKRGRPIFTIGGVVKRKFIEAVHVLAELTRKYAKNNSIYRGKALRFFTDDEGNIIHNQPPQFMDLRRVNEAELVLSDSTMEQVQTNLFAPIEHSQLCRDHKIPLKRGVLLEGPYGTGKTLLASVSAQKAVKNNWTFITVGRAAALEAALEFASTYQPCVVFVEDIDREMTGERTEEMDDILNTIDGVISKGTEIMVVLTSNHAENINRAMLRPGRLDAVLRIDPPDAKAVQALLRVYGRDLIKTDTKLDKAGLALAGQTPAVIRECVERAKLYAISARPGEEFHLADADLARAAETMDHHLALLRGPVPDDESDEHKLGKALVKVINHGLANGANEGLSKRTKRIEVVLEAVAAANGIEI